MTKLKNWFGKVKSFITRKRSLKSYAKVLVAVLVSQMVIPTAILASGPVFNQMQGDYELLRGANSSRGEQAWHDPVDAGASNVVSVIMYYHNNVVDTVAHNTTLKAVLPTDSSKTQLVINGTLSADNASAVNDTMTINLTDGVDSKVEYVTGSTNWYFAQDQQPKPLADTITTSGVNIGDIKGCWDYAGYVVFQVKITPVGAPSLTFIKKVANSTADAGTYNWVKSNTANAGDTLAYQLYFENDGQQAVNNAVIADQLPSHVSYLPGTTKLYTKATGDNGSVLADTITTAGVNIGDIKPGLEYNGYIVLQAKVDSNLTAGSYQLTNNATIKSSNYKELNDTAITSVVIAPPVQNPDLTIAKNVQNVTKGDSSYIKQTTAYPNDTLNFKIDFGNDGKGTAKNVKIQDVLPTPYTQYKVDSAMIYIKDVMNKKIDASQLFGNGLSISDLTAGQSGFITFAVTALQIPTLGPFNQVNKAVISASNATSKEDTASFTITKPAPKPAAVQITKTVTNLTYGDGSFNKTATGYSTDTFRFNLTFTNPGQSTATNVNIFDQLPAEMKFLSGTIYLLKDGQKVKIEDNAFSGGILIGDLAVNQTLSLQFDATFNKDEAAGAEFTNTGTIKADNNLEALDTAKVIVKEQIKPTPTPVTPVTPTLPTSLPKTGASVAIALLITSILVSAYYFLQEKLKFKKIVRSIKIN